MGNFTAESKKTEFQPRRAFEGTSGSPFPSPKLRRKILDIANLKVQSLDKNPTFASAGTAGPDNLPSPQVSTQHVHAYSDNDHNHNLIQQHDLMPERDVAQNPPKLLFQGVDNDFIYHNMTNTPIFGYEDAHNYRMRTNDDSVNMDIEQGSHHFKSPVTFPTLTTDTNDGYPPLPPYARRYSTPSSTSDDRSINLVGRRRASLPHVDPPASLVGSFEESLLSGRMSAPPSKPLPFVAEIGCVGFTEGSNKDTDGQGTEHRKKNWVGRVRRVEFAAVYFEWDARTPLSTSSDTSTEGEASPYVGWVDLDGEPNIDNCPEHLTSLPRSTDSGPYRLPFSGQLQIVIKNQTRTAVKIFLLPYDFRDMPPGTKTFLRQKHYINGVLQFAVHAHFICTFNKRKSSQRSSNGTKQDKNGKNKEKSKRRLYLYRSLRVVFSHRTGEGSTEIVTEGPGLERYVAVGEHEYSANCFHTFSESETQTLNEHGETPYQLHEDVQII